MTTKRHRPKPTSLTRIPRLKLPFTRCLRRYIGPTDRQGSLPTSPGRYRLSAPETTSIGRSRRDDSEVCTGHECLRNRTGDGLHDPSVGRRRFPHTRSGTSFKSLWGLCTRERWKGSPAHERRDPPLCPSRHCKVVEGSTPLDPVLSRTAYHNFHEPLRWTSVFREELTSRR